MEMFLSQKSAGFELVKSRETRKRLMGLGGSQVKLSVAQEREWERKMNWVSDQPSVVPSMYSSLSKRMP